MTRENTANAPTARAALDQTAFYRARTFTKETLRDFMFAQSQSYPEALAIMDRLARSAKYLLTR